MTEEPFAFDALAADYDSHFTRGTVGTLMRQAVWRRLEKCFAPGDRILEVNCGTGEDALYLARRGVRVLATDRSAAMLEVARRKVKSEGLAAMVEVRQMAIEQLAEVQSCGAAAPPLDPPFDGALSNFGGLNCVADLAGVARGLAMCLRRRARAILVVMGPVVPWEWAWFLARAQPRKAFRRLRPGGTPWRGLTIRYPSIRSVRRTFEPAFRLRRTSALGALIPPTYVESWAVKHRRLLSWLNRLERRGETWPPLTWLADHYLLELERR